MEKSLTYDEYSDILCCLLLALGKTMTTEQLQTMQRILHQAGEGFAENPGRQRQFLLALSERVKGSFPEAFLH